MAVIADLEDHVKPWLIDKDPDRIKICGSRRRCAHVLAQSASDDDNCWSGHGYGPVGYQTRARRNASYESRRKARDAVPIYDTRAARQAGVPRVLRRLHGQRYTRRPHPSRMAMAAVVIFPAGRGAGPRRAIRDGLRPGEYVDVIPPLSQYVRSRPASP